MAEYLGSYGQMVPALARDLSSCECNIVKFRSKHVQEDTSTKPVR